MFDILLTCNPEDILFHTEKISQMLKNEKEAEQLICVLWKRVPELTNEQEKELHKLGRKIRKKFNMKPVVIE